MNAWNIDAMAKPPASYASQVRLKAPEPEAPLSSPPEIQMPATSVASARSRPMENRSDPTIIYLHPDGKYELKRYALARGPKVKVHDLLIEAIEEWAQRHGIAAPFRVPSERPRKP
jgi:hypothetical protein